MTIYSDWLESKHSARVWLDNAMTAQCQFATIKPVIKNKRYNGRSFKEYNYGIYTEAESGDIKYLPTTYVTSRNLQSKFREILEEGSIYTFIPLYSDGWIKERDRPALFGDINTWEI